MGFLSGNTGAFNKEPIWFVIRNSDGSFKQRTKDVDIARASTAPVTIITDSNEYKSSPHNFDQLYAIARR